MKYLKFLFFIPLFFALSSCDELGSVLDDDGLSNEEVIAGLREALEVGTDNSVNLASAVDGFLGNELIRIAVPPEAQGVANFVAGLPLGDVLVDEFITQLNRAAEDASTKAKPIFVDAITGITIEDGFDILFGADNAATQYLSDNTYSSLVSTFKPDVESSLNNFGVQNAWSDVITAYNTVNILNPVEEEDLAQYATEKATDGIFKLIEVEELKIREDPVARVTDLLEKVFGELDGE